MSGRRVIYIKNPSSGSHFRTINASGGGGDLFSRLGLNSQGRRPKGYKPNGPGIPAAPGVFVGTGGARYKGAPSEWFSGGWADAMSQWQPNPYGTPSGNRLGPTDTSSLLPPPGYGGARALQGFELFVALTVATAGLAALRPDAFAPAIAGAWEMQGAHVSEMAVLQSQIAVYGARSNVAVIDLMAAGGVNMSVYDAPTVYWDNRTGRYETKYTDLLSVIYKGEDYRADQWQPNTWRPPTLPAPTPLYATRGRGKRP